MRILFFTKGDKSVASSRERVWYIAEYLKKDFGVEYTVLSGFQYPWWLFVRSRFVKLYEAHYALRDLEYNIVFVHKSLFAWDVLLLIIFSGKKIIYDLDDAEWLHSRVKSMLLARRADYVFCGSHAILEWAQKYNKQCYFVPTGVNIMLYTRYTVKHGKKEMTTIGWVGQGRAHFKAGNFEIIKNSLSVLWQQNKIFRFIIIGSQEYIPLKEYFYGVPYEVKFIDDADWQDFETVPKLIDNYQLDIGVMPLVKSPFNKAKCALKAIEYMACGIPTVASDVGEAQYLIQNNENGFLTETIDDWVKILEELVRDVLLRRKIGLAGQKTVQNSYSQEVIAKSIHEIINTCITRK
jgi:glycosyltransferase involved in cell wall biosynthesis